MPWRRGKDALLSAGGVLQNLRNTRVLLVHPMDSEGEALARQVKRIGCHVEAVWPPPAALPPCDAVFFLISQTADISWLSSDANAALIAIVSPESAAPLKTLLDSNAHGVLVQPLRASDVLPSLVLALSLRGYEQRLIGKVSKIEENLKSRREIERATRIIMETRKVSEPDAYQFIRKQATAKRVSIAAIAVSVINAHELLS
jgi:AmiR/NasT family two-component response regulator